MTIWHPNVDNSAKPRYLAVADAIAHDIAEGRLIPGTRLPTHRDLAEQLGVTVGTVSRAYNEAERRGLIQGEVGRGTFVRKTKEAISFSVPNQEPDVANLSLNFPATDSRHVQAMSAALTALAGQPNLAELLGYQIAEGLPAHRAAGAKWISRGGLAARPEQVLVTNGGQHALLVSLATLAKPGDTVMAEKLTYPGIKAIASQLGLNLYGLEMDAEGIVPTAFAAACSKGMARVLVCVPTLQNPTAATMSVERREQIAAIARAHDVMIVEDDVYGFLPQQRPLPLAAFAPERTFYLTSLSKSLLPGLRVGYLHVPENQVERISPVIRGTVWMTSPLLADIASAWIRDGTAEQLADWQRQEAMARQESVARILGRWDYQAPPASFHVWLSLPNQWRADDFTYHAQDQGVLITPADLFTVDRWSIHHAIRVCIMAPTRTQLEKALTIMDALLASPPKPRLTTI